MSAVIASWQGEQIGAVVRHWGEPTRRVRQVDRSTLEWESISELHVPGSPMSSIRPQSFALRCVRQLNIDERGTVVGGTWRGDLCCGTSLTASCAAWPNPARR